MKGLRDRVVIVTGGASGIGRATALRLAQEGAWWQLIDVDRGAASEAAEEIGAVNYQGVFLNLREMLRTARRQPSPAVIVNSGSGTGVHGVPQLGAYGSTKAAILGLTRAAAVENANAGIEAPFMTGGAYPIDGGELA